MSRVESVEVRMRPDPGRDRADVEQAFDAFGQDAMDK